MTTADLHYGQRVRWTNAAGVCIVARIVDILHGKDQAQIRVTHQTGAQLLWVRIDALAPLETDEGHETDRTRHPRRAAGRAEENPPTLG